MLLLTRGFRPLSMVQMPLGQFWIRGAAVNWFVFPQDSGFYEEAGRGRR